jgi:hypothetical protein
VAVPGQARVGAAGQARALGAGVTPAADRGGAAPAADGNGTALAAPAADANGSALAAPDDDAAAAPAALAGPVGAIPTTTRVRMPHRLALKPPGGATRLNHPAKPANRDGRVELWTSALELVQGARTTEAPVPVGLEALANAPGGTAGWQQAVDDNKLQHAIRAFTATAAANLAAQTGIKPKLNRLRLSSLGGWADLQGGWPNTLLPTLRYSGAMGRDQAQRTAVVGRLYPFGHTAIKLSETVRGFETERDDERSPTARAATLRTTTTIVVVDPVAPFPAAALHPAWPFDSVEVVTKATPPGGVESTPTGGAAIGAAVLRVGGEFFRYECRGIDRAGRAVDFDLPMLFVPGADTAAARTLWKNQGADFSTIVLDGQPLAVAPVPPPPIGTNAVKALADGEVLPAPEQATSVLARSLDLTLPATGAPTMAKVIGRVPALERFAPTAGEVALSYAQPYLDDVFADANAKGQLFLKLAEQQTMSLGGKAAGGLASLGLPVSALSAGQGVVAGADLAKLAQGKLDLSFLSGLAGDKLLGIVPLEKLLPKELDLDLADCYRAVVDVLDGVTSQVLTWDVPIFNKDAVTEPFVRLDALEPGTARLLIKQTTIGLSTTVECRIENVALEIHATKSPSATAEPLVRVPLKSVSFTSTDGETPDVDLKLGRITFGGILGFVATLADVIDQEGFSDPPALAIREDGVDSTFEFPVPALAIGIFALENIAIASTFSLRFTGEEPVKLRFAFARPEDPFRLTVSMFSGGGHLALGVSTKGLVELKGALEFGASISVDLVVASGSVEAMGGVGFHFDEVAKIAAISGYFRIRGELDVLSLIAVSVTLTLTLAYDFNTKELVGEATLAVSISVLFFHETVTLRMKRRFAGGNQDPTFLELMAPAGRPGPRPWDEYCAAFAED